MTYKKGEALLIFVIIMMITMSGFLLFDKLGCDTNSYFWCFVLGFWIIFNVLELLILIFVVPDWLERKFGRERYNRISLICALASSLIAILFAVIATR